MNFLMNYIQISLISGAAVIVAVGLTLLVLQLTKKERKQKAINGYSSSLNSIQGEYNKINDKYFNRLKDLANDNESYKDSFVSMSQIKLQIDDKFLSIHKDLTYLQECLDDKQYRQYEVKAKIVNESFKRVKKSIQIYQNDLSSMFQQEENLTQEFRNLKATFESTVQVVLNDEDHFKFIKDTFNATKGKIEEYLVSIEENIKKGEYQKAQSDFDYIKVIIAHLNKIIPTLPSLIEEIYINLEQKIDRLNEAYNLLLSEGYVVPNLAVVQNVTEFNNKIEESKSIIKKFQTDGIQDNINYINDKIEELLKAFDQEREDKKYYTENLTNIYNAFQNLENRFIAVKHLLYENNKKYLIDQSYFEKCGKIKEELEALVALRKNLDNYIHSSSLTPYTILRGKLDNISKKNNLILKEIVNTETYLNDILMLVNSAKEFLSISYLKLNGYLNDIKNVRIPNFNEKASPMLTKGFNLLNEINDVLNVEPIDIVNVEVKYKEFKEQIIILNNLLKTTKEEVSKAEQLIIWNNKFRYEFEDVKAKQAEAEKAFFNCDFATVEKIESSISSQLTKK